MNKEIEISPRQIANAITDLLNENEQLQQENFNLREGIFVEKMSFPSENRNFKELMEMPTYQELERENKELKEGNTIYNQFVNYKNWYFDYVDKYEKLHNKIDKAIRYINKHRADGGYLDIREVKELLKILKDSDVDDN